MLGMRGSMGARAFALMPVELRAVAVSPSRPGSGDFCAHSSPLFVPLVWDGVSGLTSWQTIALSFAESARLQNHQVGMLRADNRFSNHSYDLRSGVIDRALNRVLQCLARGRAAPAGSLHAHMHNAVLHRFKLNVAAM